MLWILLISAHPAMQIVNLAGDLTQLGIDTHEFASDGRQGTG